MQIGVSIKVELPRFFYCAVNLDVKSAERTDTAYATQHTYNEKLRAAGYMFPTK